MKRIFDIDKLETYVRCVQQLAKLSISIYDKDFGLLISTHPTDYSATDEGKKEITDFLKSSLAYKKFNMRRWKGESMVAAKPVYLKDELIGFILLNHFRYSGNVSPLQDVFLDGLIICEATRIQSTMTILEFGMFQYIREARPKVESKQKNYCADLQKYIDTHLSENLTLQLLCDKFNLSRGQIARLFREGCGTSFQSYVISARLNQAKKLLAETDLPIREIGEQVGYSKHAFFDKSFKKYIGCTPTEYRENAVKK